MIRDVRWLEHDAYFTPGPAAEQHLRGVAALLRHERRPDPAVVVDVGAGAGVYLQRARLVWPRARLVAVEVRPEEAEHLRRWADVVVIAAYDDAAVADAIGERGGDHEAVVGNFPFKDAAAISLWARRRGSTVSSLLPAGFGDREDAEAILVDDPPTHSLRPTGGRMGFLGDGKDFQHHEALTWLPGPARPWGGWRTLPLPPLPDWMRRWHVRPGTERAFAPLPSHLYPDFGAPRGV